MGRLSYYHRHVIHRVVKRRASKEVHETLRDNRVKKMASHALRKEIDAVVSDETIWFRPEKWKIMLSFLQVFSEYRRTYKIKWPALVSEYMGFFSGLVDFDVFQFTSFDCIVTYTCASSIAQYYRTEYLLE